LAVLAGAGPGAAAGPGGQLALAGRLMLQALPITAILFVLFPRIPGPLWNLPDLEQHKRLGLGDLVEIGSVTALRLSPDVAFRVDFQGRVPPPADRYWRGPVFSRFDGHRWTQLPGMARVPALRAPQVNGEPYRQTITLEPTNRRWVFALDIPGPPAPELVQTHGYNLAARHDLRERSRHLVDSFPDYRLEAALSGELMHALALPDEPSPRVQALVEEWRAKSPEPLDIARAALHHFRTGDFLYTLDVDPIKGDVVDTFLFETRKGFCEHYATAFITLMRFAGIPARLVTGYKGGAWNPVGKFLEVRQYDAHGWAEIHLEDRGWVRIDPTAAVTSASIDPELAEQWRRADNERQGQDQDQGEDGAAAKRSAVDRALDWMKMAWASTDHAWNRWVLSYTPEAQQQFWQQLRTHDWRSTMFWAGAVFTVLGTAAALLLAPRLGLRLDPAVAHYRRFLRRLARRGVIRRPGEGPLDFGRRAATERPEAAAAIDRITELFLRLRYGRSPQGADLGELRRRVSRFRA
ncbi:MAG: DUF3488 domain-containing protein, partial [Gammaproteobacteria bacterium]|nr:DUF3488 domain-containing protein [Gammaproteobacteria bacterium]